MELKRIQSEEYLEYTLKPGVHRKDDAPKGALLDAANKLVSGKTAYETDANGEIVKTFKGQYKVWYESVVGRSKTRFAVIGKTNAEIEAEAKRHVALESASTQPKEATKGPAKITV